jgi:hypothetical protein
LAWAQQPWQLTVVEGAVAVVVALLSAVVLVSEVVGVVRASAVVLVSEVAPVLGAAVVSEERALRAQR